MALEYQHERPLFVIALIFSIMIWLGLIIGTFGMALIFILLFYIVYLFTHSGFICYLKGTGVRVDEEQFPDLDGQLKECCATLGMQKIPETYILHAGGVFNALATRFLRRNYVVLFSDIVDALDTHKTAVKFYIGHELGHIKKNHLLWGWVLAPALILPLLGAAYHRAREYTCDRFGLACCAGPEDALYGLGVLSAGGKRWASLRYDRFISQSAITGSFWMSFHELTSDYPWLVKRVAHMDARAKNETPRFPGRHPLAWFFAFFMPRVGHVGAGGGFMVIIAVIGILAAIAVPQFMAFREKGYESLLRSELSQVRQAEESYYLNNSRYTDDFDELDFTPSTSEIDIEILSANEECFEAAGKHTRLKKTMRIDCQGNVDGPGLN